jgi:hypothetical protein
MSAKFVTVTHNGIHWLAVEWDGKRVILHPQAPVGHCFRPGQRSRLA